MIDNMISTVCNVKKTVHNQTKLIYKYLTKLSMYWGKVYNHYFLKLNMKNQTSYYSHFYVLDTYIYFSLPYIWRIENQFCFYTCVLILYGMIFIIFLQRIVSCCIFIQSSPPPPYHTKGCRRFLWLK